MGASLRKTKKKQHINIHYDDERADKRFRELPDKVMMELILNHWLFRLNVDIKTFPVEVVNIIIDQYLYQTIHWKLNKVPRGKRDDDDDDDGLYDWHYLFKIMVIGDWKKGKTSLMLRFTENTYDPDRYKIHFKGSVVGYNKPPQLKSKTINFGDMRIKLMVWNEMNDNHERMRLTNDMRRRHYNGAHGVLFCCSLTDSYINITQQIKKWNEECDKFTGGNVEKVIVGTKCDLINERRCSKQEMIQISMENNIKHIFETSAKKGTNIEELFEHLGELLVNKMNYPYQDDQDNQDIRCKCRVVKI